MVSQGATSTLAAAPLKDGVHVTVSASYKEHDDAKDGPLQPGQYGMVVQGGGTSRVQVRAQGSGAEGGGEVARAAGWRGGAEEGRRGGSGTCEVPRGTQSRGRERSSSGGGLTSPNVGS